MSAIITSKFRLDTTTKFVDSLADNQFYMAIGRPNKWTAAGDDDVTPDTPFERDDTNNTLWQNMFAMKKLDATDVVHGAIKNIWTYNGTYAEYDDQDTELENKIYFVTTLNNNVYICLKAGTLSTVDPDVLGIVTVGNHAKGADGYIWKYMFTIPTIDVTKFLTSSFIPVRHLKSDPILGSDLALENQWLVQVGAVDGAIYNMKVKAAGTGYATAPTLLVVGDGTNATATCTVSSGAINDITMTNPGAGYTQAHVVITNSGASSGTDGVIRPVIGPQGGFGADATNDLRAHYATLNKAFTGDEAAAGEDPVIPDSNDFRQIAILKNPIANAAALTIATASVLTIGNFYKISEVGTSTAANWLTIGATDPTIGAVFKATAITSTGTGQVLSVASTNAYNVCKKLTVSHSNVSGSVTTFPVDQIIEGHTSGDNGLLRAKGQVVEYLPNSGASPTAGVISYIQNEVTGYGTFLETHYVREDGTGGAGRDITAVTAPDITHNTGDVMFIENKTKTSRNTDQTETIRLVIAF